MDRPPRTDPHSYLLNSTALRLAGIIAEGFLADITVLDANLLTVDPEKIPSVKVLRTFVGGKQRYGEGA